MLVVDSGLPSWHSRDRAVVQRFATQSDSKEGSFNDLYACRDAKWQGLTTPCSGSPVVPADLSRSSEKR